MGVRGWVVSEVVGHKDVNSVYETLKAPQRKLSLQQCIAISEVSTGGVVLQIMLQIAVCTESLNGI
jgi:hypothetical protein